MTDQSPATMADLRKARITGGVRSILAILLDPPTQQHDRTVAYLRLRTELTEAERAELLDVLLGSFPADLAEIQVQAHFEGAGYPKPTLTGDALGDARLWAEYANSAELRAYAMACVEQMAPKTVTAFHNWLAGQEGKA